MKIANLKCLKARSGYGFLEKSVWWIKVSFGKICFVTVAQYWMSQELALFFNLINKEYLAPEPWYEYPLLLLLNREELFPSRNIMSLRTQWFKWWLSGLKTLIYKALARNTFINPFNKWFRPNCMNFWRVANPVLVSVGYLEERRLL